MNNEQLLGIFISIAIVLWFVANYILKYVYRTNDKGFNCPVCGKNRPSYYRFNGEICYFCKIKEDK